MSDEIKPKINFYDFFYDTLSYLAPGIIIVILLYWLAFNFIKGIFMPINAVQNITSSGAIFLIIASYVCGHIVQAISKKLEDKANKANRTEKSSVKQYRDYNEKLNNRLHEYALKEFNLPKDTPEYMIFELCRYYILQKGYAPKTEMFFAFYSLFRGLHFTAFPGCMVCILIAFKNLFLYLLLSNNFSMPEIISRNFKLDYNLPQFVYALLFLGIFYLLQKKLVDEYKMWDAAFVSSVYRNFVLLCMSKGVGVMINWLQDKEKDDEVYSNSECFTWCVKCFKDKNRVEAWRANGKGYYFDSKDVNDALLIYNLIKSLGNDRKL